MKKSAISRVSKASVGRGRSISRVRQAAGSSKGIQQQKRTLEAKIHQEGAALLHQRQNLYNKLQGTGHKINDLLSLVVRMRIPDWQLDQKRGKHSEESLYGRLTMLQGFVGASAFRPPRPQRTCVAAFSFELTRLSRC